MPPVDTEADMSERHARGLARLAEVCLAQAEALHERVLTADDAKDAADWGLAFQRAARSYRQTIALEARLVRERRLADREIRDDAAKQRSAQIHKRRAQVQSALNQLIWTEYDRPEAEALEMVVDDRLDAEELADAFTTEPLEAQVERIRKSIGLAPEPQPPAPEPTRVPPPIDDDCWRSSA